MAAIFISYRRADAGWAAWLADALEQQYDIFFDTNTIEYGDNFPDRITEALKEFQIFLAVIGPKWIEKKHLKRLADPKDWVRQEIKAGLDRSHVRLVPVLVGGATPPAEDKLPEELRPLTQQNAISISHEKRKSDLKLLTSKLDGWLSGSAYSASTRNPIPPVLPYLCNRTAQEDDLVEVFTDEQSATKTPIVILHGHKWEEHIGFIERLRYQHILEDLLGVREQDVGVAVNTLQWNVDRAAEGKYEKVLFAAVKRNVLEVLTASDQEVQAHFQAIRQPHVLMLQITWSDYQRCGDHLLKGFILSWRNLFQIKRENAQPLQIDPPHAVVLWINVSYDDPAQTLPFDNILKETGQQTYNTLSKLKPLSEGDIQAWVSVDDVKRHVAGFEGRVLSLIEDERRCIEKGKIRMRSFVEAVQEILT